mgnify:CR=1 FL=1
MSDVLNVPLSPWRQDEEIKIFNEAVSQFFEKELKPHVEDWREAGAVPRDVWYKAAEQGLLLVSAPEEYGGAGGDFRHDAVIIEQLELQGIAGFGIGLHNAIVAPYIIHYGSEEQKQQWLMPLLEGKIRSAFCMTEPDVASSDATNMAATAIMDGDEVVLNGRKWWSTGIGHPDCKVLIFMGLTNPDAPKHAQHLAGFFSSAQMKARGQHFPATLRRVHGPRCGMVL